MESSVTTRDTGTTGTDTVEPAAKRADRTTHVIYQGSKQAQSRLIKPEEH
jgi:hypothetical protein